MEARRPWRHSNFQKEKKIAKKIKFMRRIDTRVYFILTVEFLSWRHNYSHASGRGRLVGGNTWGNNRMVSQQLCEGRQAR